MEVGQLSWLYNKWNGGLGGRAIHFIKQPEQPITWIGSSGNANLAAVCNWQLTTGGAFAGFVDEANSLNFNGASGGALNNNVPTSTRLRAIPFGASAGAYTMSGNQIELEAIHSNITNNQQLRGITLNSPATVTINCSIAARSAALYHHLHGRDQRAGSVTKTRSNTQTFSSNNTYTGGTYLNGGTLQASYPGSRRTSAA